MPRKSSPKKTHFPIKMLRAALGMTQAEFAAFVGIGGQTVAQIEIGARNLTLEVAEKIMYATGVDPVSLMSGRFAKELWSDDEYTSDSFDHWRHFRESLITSDEVDALTTGNRLAEMLNGGTIDAECDEQFKPSRALHDYIVLKIWKRLLESETNRATPTRSERKE